MQKFTRIAAVTDIPLGSMRGFEIGHHRLVVAHTEDGFFAVTDECTHDSAPISDGRIDGHEVECARHGARFDLRSGAVTAPPAVVPIDTLELKIEQDNILVLLEG